MPPPVVLLSRVDTGRCVLGNEVQHVFVDVIGRVPRITLSVNATKTPVLRGAFLAIWHTTAVGIRVPPISANLLLYRVRNAIAVSINWIQIISGVVLRIGPIEILLTIHYSAVVCVRDVPHGVVGVEGAVTANSENQ